MRYLATKFQLYLLSILLFVGCTKSNPQVQRLPVASFSSLVTGSPLYKADFSVISPVPGTRYFWDFNDGVFLSDTLASSVTHCYYILTSYMVRVAKSNTIDTTAKPIYIGNLGTFIPQTPQVFDFSYKITASAPYNVVFTNTSSSFTNAIWNFGDNTSITSNATTVNHTYSQSGFYNVQLIVSDGSGFSDTTTAVLDLNL